jgi:hypothetical protein
MRELVTDILTSYNQMRKRLDAISQPSIPIVYYGDYNQYTKSSPKVITIGINPSHLDFPPDSKLSRFPEANKIDFSQYFDEKEYSRYLNAMNNYFKIDPLDWFESYDRVLNGLNTSFYPNTSGNNALHTYICSPFATDPPWSKLKNSTQYTLSREGRKFWLRLLEILMPDMILCSIARKYLERISFKRSSWEVFTSITEKKDGTPRAKPYDIEISEIALAGKKSYIVYGKPLHMRDHEPFGSLTFDAKTKLGEDLINLLL